MSARMKVLAICPIPQDGTAWWRVISPLSVLREQSMGAFDFEVMSNVDHVQISKCDLLLLQRPVRPEDLAYMQVAKRQGIPVVVEYDDDYTGVPANNPRMLAYMVPDVQQRVRELLSGADLVITSTPELKMRWRQFNKRIAIVPNAWDDRFHVERGADRLPTLNIMWRGGDSHNHDLEQFAQAMVRAAWEGDPALWHFVGSSMWNIHDKMPPASMTEYPFTDVISYFNLLGQLRPNILIVPLADTPFNRAKSNISVMEGAWAGAAVLAPDWEDWRIDGVTTYRNASEFGMKLVELTKKPRAELAALADATWAKVRDNMLVSRANKLRSAMFGALVDEKRQQRHASQARDDKLAEIVSLVAKQAAPAEAPPAGEPTPPAEAQA